MQGADVFMNIGTADKNSAPEASQRTNNNVAR